MIKTSQAFGFIFFFFVLIRKCLCISNAIGIVPGKDEPLQTFTCAFKQAHKAKCMTQLNRDLLDSSVAASETPVLWQTISDVGSKPECAVGRDISA